MAIGSHQSARMISDTWLTPPEIIAALGPFDLDPCAAPDPRPWPTAARHIVLPDDGLKGIWAGRVWLNPPYGDKTGTWLGRLARHGHGTALIFARTETSWFVEHVWQAATAALFLHGRLHFHRADGRRAESNSGAPSVLVAYGAHDAARLQECGLPGTFVRWQAQATGEMQQLELFAS
jgi:DNA N-6-adenine-methyltransferase (Dam)